MATMVGRDKVKKDQMMLGTLLNQFKRGQINKNHPLQRKADQWTPEAKSGLVASIIKGEDIDSIKICEQILDSSSFVLWLIDGLQRLTVLDSYRNNAYAIGKSLEMPIMYYQGVDENGVVGVIEYDLRNKKYKDLPDELKERFDSYGIDIVKHLDCTDEEIAYHMARYNRQTNMNVNQKNILSAWKVAPRIKALANNRFFVDCGDFTSREETKEVFNRIVCESIMTMFHLDDWKKSKQMSLYLNKNATEKEFDIFEDELNRLYGIIDQDTIGKLFNAKNSFIWFAAFHKFTSFGLADLKFADFLGEFQRTLHSKAFSEYDDKSFDVYDSGKGTKDKKVVMDKLDMLEKLMREYFRIDGNEKSTEDKTEVIKESAALDLSTENNTTEVNDNTEIEICDEVLSFARENVDENLTEEDISLYSDMIDDYVKIDSLIYEKCRTALIALMAYVCKNDKDREFGEWIKRHQNQTSFAPVQKTNYIFMKNSFDRMLSA